MQEVIIRNICTRCGGMEEAKAVKSVEYGKELTCKPGVISGWCGIGVYILLCPECSEKFDAFIQGAEVNENKEQDN